MMQREGVYIKVLEIFSMVVLEAVQLFGSESWFLLEATEKTMEGAHTGFLHQIMGKWARWIMGGMWVINVEG